MASSVAMAACHTPRASAPQPVGDPTARAPRVERGDLEAQIVLGDLPARATRYGASPASVVASGEMVEGERSGAFVEVPPELCLLAYARGSSSLEDLDVAAFAEEGNPVALDEGPDPRPTLVLCPPHPSRVYVAVHAVQGQGLAALAAQLVSRERAEEVARALGARGTIGLGPRPAEGWLGLDDKVRERRLALGGKWQETRRVAVPVDAHAPTAVSFPMEADSCVDVLVVPDEDVVQIEVEVLDGEGRTLARAKDSGPTRALTLCSPLAMNGTVWLRPHLGRGLAAVVLATARSDVARDLAARPEVAWSASAVGIEAATQSKNTLLAKAGYPSASQQSGQLLVGRRALVPIELPGAGCVRIDVVAGSPLALVGSALWMEGKAGAVLSAAGLLSSDEATDGGTLFGCAAGRSRARLELDALGRPGPYAVLTRRERWADPSFVRFPLAASRMLRRAAVGQGKLLEGAPSSVRALSVDAARQSTWDVTIPPNKCLVVAVGAQGEGTGLELRLSDIGTSEELDRAHGATAAAVRACSLPAQPRAVRTDLRATSGLFDVVAGERLIDRE